MMKTWLKSCSEIMQVMLCLLIFLSLDRGEWVGKSELPIPFTPNSHSFLSEASLFHLFCNAI